MVFTAGAASVISLNPAPSTAVPGGNSTITAAVLDGNGNPVSGEVLTFSFAQRGSGTPSLSATTVATDINGLARVTYTAGANAGADIVTATASNAVAAAGLSRATITVASNAVVVGSILASTSKGSITVSTGTAQISAVVKDVSGVVLAGQTVTFVASSGSLTASSAVTDTNGIATTSLVAGASVLTSTVSASVGGYTSNVSVAFTAGAANTVAVSTAPAAIKIAGTSTFSALVVDANSNPVAGETVTFAITVKGSGLPTLGSQTAVTSANGLAVVSYTAGASAGTDTITATTSNAKVGSASITSAANTTVVNNVLLSTGAASIATGGSTTFVRAKVTDIDGLAAVGISVNFTTSAGTLTGGLTSVTVVTDNTGTAQLLLTSSNNLGTANIVANASGFVATSSVTFASGNSTSVALTGSASLTSGGAATLTALVRDVNGNPVPYETVTFTFASNLSGGSLASATAVTSVNGLATVVYTAGIAAGIDTVVATLTNGTASTAVSMTVLAGASAAKLSIATSSGSVKSDNSNSATITVTAINSANVVVPGVTINFSSTGGILTLGSAVTNASGQATVAISSGNLDPTTRTITVTAVSAGASSVSIPIQITGSAITLSTTGGTSLVSGVSPTSTTLNVKATDAGGNAVAGTPVTLVVSGAGNVTLAPVSGNTDSNGQLAVTVTGQSPGTSTVTVTALGVSRTQDFTVSASGSEFKISSPVSPATLVTTTGLLPFNVQIGADATITQVRLSTTIGTWSVCTGGTGVGTSVCLLPSTAFSGAYPNQTATATLISLVAGAASVQVEALDASSKVLVTVPASVAITSATAASISLQSSVSVLQPSSIQTPNNTSVIATVRDASNQPVGNAAVTFSIVNPTGGGETVSPALSLSSDGTTSIPIGQARTIFTAGSLPSTPGGVTIRGMVVGIGNGVCPASGTAICADTVINIGDTAGSIVIGQSTTIGIAPNDTTNTTYMSTLNLLVSNSNGNPVSGAVVSLNVWPVSFRTGIYTYDASTSTCSTTTYAEFPNEDVNKNLILDAGEALTTAVAMAAFQTTYAGTPGSWATPYVVQSNQLIPPAAAAGNVPATVTTDSNGLASFNLIYLKQYASWIVAQITATTIVQGTEATSSIKFALDKSKADMSSSPCVLRNSPWNTK